MAVNTATSRTASVLKFTCHGVGSTVLLLNVGPAQRRPAPPAWKTATVISQVQ